MANSHDVVVVGSYVQDLSFRCLRFPSPGETALGAFSTGCGGKGFNQAIAAARLGTSTVFVGAVGGDSFASQAIAFAKTEGLAFKIAHKKDSTTGTAGIIVNDSGENQIVVALGANTLLSRRDLPSKQLQKARVVVAQLEVNLATVEHALRLAWDCGVVTVLNPAPMRPDFSPRLLKYTDVLIPNEVEFCQLAHAAGLLTKAQATPEHLKELGATKLHALCQLLGPPTVIITLGKRGCLVSHPEGFTEIPAEKGIKAIDTTGAGDAFVGGFASGLVHFDGDLLKAARLATTVAGLSVTKNGTAQSMPTQREIAAFLRKKPQA